MEGRNARSNLVSGLELATPKNPGASRTVGHICIDRRWLPLNALRAFEAVGRHLSFSAGAQSLNVTPGALSRQVASLENLVQCKLLDRRPYATALTNAGAALLPIVTQALDSLQQCLNDTLRDQSSLSRPLTVHFPPVFFRFFAAPLLPELRKSFCGAIDITSHYEGLLASREVDLAVLQGPPSLGESHELLWMMNVMPLCAPELAPTAQDQDMGAYFSRQELLHVRREGHVPRSEWAAFAAGAGLAIDTDRGIVFDTLDLAIEYASRGGGIVLGDETTFGGLISEGTLTRPCDLASAQDLGYFLAIRPEAADNRAAVFLRDHIRLRSRVLAPLRIASRYA